MKKKLFALFLAMAMALSLGACGGDKPSGGESGSSAPAAQPSTGETTDSSNDAKVIAVVPKTLNNPFFVAMVDSLRNACESRGWTVKVNAADAETEVDKQVSIVEAFIEEGVDVIVMGPSSATALVDTINAAAAKGIAVFLIDSGADECEYQAFIGTDNYIGGQTGAEWIGENVKSGKVAILDGFSGNDATTQRQKGFMDKIAEYPDIEVVASEYANCEISKGMEVTENFLVAYPDLTAIFAVNDMMAIGAGQAVEAAGKRDQITICGFDGQPDAAQKIIEGTIDATIAQKPATMGTLMAETIETYFNGGSIQRSTDTGCDVVTKENAETYLNWQ